MKTFKQFLEGKKKSQPTISKKDEFGPMTIKIPLKIATGHVSHASGTGVHDSRPKRQRTRNAQKLAWKKDQE